MAYSNSTMNIWWKQYRHRVLGFWTARSKQEQFWLKLGSVVILAGSIYGVLIAPTWTARIHLTQTLPTLRQQLSQLQTVLKEADSIRTQNLDIPSEKTVLSKEALEQLFSSKNVPAESVTVLEHQVKVQWASVPFSGLINGLSTAQKMFALSVEDAVIHPTEKKGWVNASITLRR